MCTCLAFCCYGRHHDQIKLREEKSLFCLTPDNPPLSGNPRQGTQGKNLGAATEAEPVGKTAYWLDLHNLLSLLFLATQDNVPGVAALTVDWALSFQSLTKKMTHRHAHRAR